MTACFIAYDLKRKLKKFLTKYVMVNPNSNYEEDNIQVPPPLYFM